MDAISYSVLIRTLNSGNTLPITLQSIEQQTLRPTQYIIVDSGSSDNTRDVLPHNCIIHRFAGERFNYAEALNQGITYTITRYVLIISSHTALENSQAVECALHILQSRQDIGAAYFCNDNSGSMRFDLIDKCVFDGFNGLWNTCSLVRTDLLRERGFRSDVFTAEDQEWASWLLTHKALKIARISGAGMMNRNSKSQSLRKRTNEYIAIAYFVNRRLLSWRNIARVGFRAVVPSPHNLRYQRLYYLWLFYRLISCHITKPRAESKYF